MRMLPPLMTGDQTRISFWMNSTNFSDPNTMGVMPKIGSDRRACISGVFKIASNSFSKSEVIARGVCTGAEMPNHETACTPGASSSKVGTSGNPGTRFSLVTASTLRSGSVDLNKLTPIDKCHGVGLKRCRVVHGGGRRLATNDRRGGQLGAHRRFHFMQPHVKAASSIAKPALAFCHQDLNDLFHCCTS